MKRADEAPGGSSEGSRQLGVVGVDRARSLLLAPYLVGLIVLVAGPFAATFVLALTDWDLLRPPGYVGLANFTDLPSDPVFRAALRNTLQYAAWVAPLRVAAALGLGLVLHRRAWGLGPHRVAAVLPSVVPEIAAALGWLWLFNPVYGPVNIILESLGVKPVAWLTQPGAAQAAVIIMGLFTIGEGFLIVMVTRRAIPSELYDLAAVEGAGPVSSFRRISLPLLAPTLLLLLARDTVFSLQASFIPSLVVTDGGPPPDATTYLPLFVYRTGFEYLRYGYAAAATTSMFVISALIVAAQWWMVRRWRSEYAI